MEYSLPFAIIRGFSLIETLICIGLISLLIPLFATTSFALRDSIARTGTRSILIDEELLLFDDSKNLLGTPSDGFVSIDHLIQTHIGDATSPAFQIEAQLSATTTQGQHLTDTVRRTIWPHI